MFACEVRAHFLRVSDVVAVHVDCLEAVKRRRRRLQVSRSTSARFRQCRRAAAMRTAAAVAVAAHDVALAHSAAANGPLAGSFYAATPRGDLQGAFEQRLLYPRCPPEFGQLILNERCKI